MKYDDKTLEFLREINETALAITALCREGLLTEDHGEIVLGAIDALEREIYAHVQAKSPSPTPPAE